MSTIQQSMLYGHLKDALGNEIDVASDLEKVLEDEQDIVSRPDVLKRIAATTIGAIGSAAYFNGTLNLNATAIKAVYAAFAGGIGINVGMMAGDSRADAVAAAAIYYGFSRASGFLNVTGNDRNIGYEAMVAMVAGLAADYWLSKQSNSKPKPKHGHHGQ